MSFLKHMQKHFTGLLKISAHPIIPKCHKESYKSYKEKEIHAETH